MKKVAPSSAAEGAKVRGVTDFSIIALYALKGKGIFKYLRHYEDSNSRCR